LNTKMLALALLLITGLASAGVAQVTLGGGFKYASQSAAMSAFSSEYGAAYNALHAVYGESPKYFKMTAAGGGKYTVAASPAVVHLQTVDIPWLKAHVPGSWDGPGVANNFLRSTSFTKGGTNHGNVHSYYQNYTSQSW